MILLPTYSQQMSNMTVIRKTKVTLTAIKTHSYLLFCPSEKRNFSEYLNLLLRMRWRGRREDGRDEKEAALRDEVNGRNQINAIVTGVGVRLLPTSSLNGKVS